MDMGYFLRSISLISIIQTIAVAQLNESLAYSNRTAFDPSATRTHSGQPPVKESLPTNSLITPIKEEQPDSKKKPKSPFGVGYFIFFDGPGVTQETIAINPNWLGRPSDDGLRLFNLISLKWRFSERLALDFQTRTELILTNGVGRTDFAYARWQSPRIGISGKLARGDYWSVDGAINTDFPYMLPSPLGGGFQATQRTVLLNPGFFAVFTYKTPNSPVSIYSLITPRYFLYKDRTAAEPQLLASGLSGSSKPELVLQLSPSLDYAFNKVWALRLGTQIDYRKLVGSSWNPLTASMKSSDDESTAWRLWPTPVRFGPNININQSLQIFGFLQTFPIAIQRARSNGSKASLLASTSIGMWISGSIL